MTVLHYTITYIEPTLYCLRVKGFSEHFISVLLTACVVWLLYWVSKLGVLLVDRTDLFKVWNLIKMDRELLRVCIAV